MDLTEMGKIDFPPVAVQSVGFICQDVLKKHEVLLRVHVKP